MFISESSTASTVLPEKLLVKFSNQYHALAKVTFADNLHKFDSCTTLAVNILNDWL